MTNQEQRVREILVRIWNQECETAKECNEAIAQALSSIMAIVGEKDNLIEKLRVQLAACGVAALGYAKGENEVKKGDYGWSASFQDVKDLWDKYISLNKRKKEALGEEDDDAFHTTPGTL